MFVIFDWETMTTNIDLICDERLSDSPYVETVWHSYSGMDAGSFLSMAEYHCGMVITRMAGKTIVTIRGPEIRATPAFSPSNAEFTGIIFKAGVFMPNLPTKKIMNRNDVNLPEASSRSFWLDGESWQFPDYENVDTFVDCLIRNEVLVYDPLVQSVLRDEPTDVSLRTMQRRFSQATGLTKGLALQIERARYATMLLKNGVSILDTMYQAGYYDQPHMTRSLKHFIGQTPSQLIDENRKIPLSFLYKTLPFVADYDTYVR